MTMENKIKELRKLKRLSQDQLAQVCGVSRQTINAIENNKYDPSLELAFQLAEHLEVRVDELFLFRSRT
jgi:putative transcriptional regulator